MSPAPLVVDYDPAWPERYERLRAVVEEAVGGEALRIDHIGSTSVPGLAAKDIVDIQVTVAALEVADRWPDEIGPFRRRAHVIDDHVPPCDTPGPQWRKRYWVAADPAAHLHVRQNGWPNQRYALLFRDYLRADPAAAGAYGEAKRRLAVLCDSTAVYADAKDPVCDLVMCGAEAWAVRVGWEVPAASPWLPAGFAAPRRADLGTGHHLRPIRAADVDIDYPAVMGSRQRLWAMFGEAWGWPPDTMTMEQDREDLARHEAEAGANLSFNYAVLDEGETELLGCVYVDPPERQGADAEISWWVVDRLAGGPVEEALDDFVPAWIAGAWPFRRPRYIGRDLSREEWLALPPATAT
ncbi:MAG TPA: GrpB family protein [Acidimicrobiales bacterium]|nr:GrpB family protein [Acidimicrobiales bacterium]